MQTMQTMQIRMRKLYFQLIIVLVPSLLKGTQWTDNADNADNADYADNADTTDNTDNADNADNADSSDKLYNIDNMDKYFTIWTFSLNKASSLDKASL